MDEGNKTKKFLTADDADVGSRFFVRVIRVIRGYSSGATLAATASA
jgi:hypothetical protein